METFCKNLPKIELHAHLNGSFTSDTLKQLGCFDESIFEYQKLNSNFGQTDKALEACFHLFRVAHDATKTKETIYTATRCVIKDFLNDNVVYLELRTTPRCEENLTKREYIETVIKAIKDDDGDIIVKLLLCIDRRHDSEMSNEVLDLIIDMKNENPNIVKGIDLCGDPTKGSFDRKLFEKARDNGLHVSIHCAEIKNDAEVLDMLDFRPERIGHGTALHSKYGGSEEIWKAYEKLKIPTECCLTSNVLCGTSRSYAEHHISEWIKHALPFSLATDDKGVFSTTLSQEYMLMQETFKLSKEDLWAISYNTIDQTFASVEEKNELKDILNNWKQTYLCQ